MRKWKHLKKYQSCFLVTVLWANMVAYGVDEESVLQLSVTRSKGVISGDVHFMVTGPNRAENVEVAAWADDVYRRVAGLLGRDLPRLSGERLIQIVLTYDRSGAKPVVAIRQYSTDVGFVQELDLRNVGRDNQDEAVEALCRLLLARFAKEEGRGSAHSDCTGFPGWLVYGMASHFSALQRAANRMVVVDAWKKGMNLDIVSVLHGGMPPVEQRAAEGEFFEWIADRPDRTRILNAVIQRGSSDVTLDAQTILCDVMGFASVKKASQEWDLHVVSLQNVVLVPGICEEKDLDAFAESIQVSSIILSTATGQDIQGSYPLRSLIAYRYELWMPAVCEAVSLRMQEAAVGKARALQEVASFYQSFLDMLSAAQDDDHLFKYTTAEQLEEELERAEKAFKELEYKVETGQIKPLSATLTTNPIQESGKE